MEGHVPRAIWRRRRTTDSPRPAGAAMGRPAASGRSFARQMLLVSVGRRGAAPLIDAPERRRPSTHAPAWRRSTTNRAGQPGTAPRAHAPLDSGRRRYPRGPEDATDAPPGADPAPARRAHGLPADQVRAGAGLHAGEPAAGHDRDHVRGAPAWTRVSARPACSPASPSTASTARSPASSAWPARSAYRWTRWAT